MSDGTVECVRDGAVLRLTLDRPERRNSLSHSMIDHLVAQLTAAAYDDSLRAVCIEGAGSDFCSGADWVATNDAGRRPRPGELGRRIPHTANRVIELLTTIQLPVVCVVRGWAVGLGCNLALAADFTVAADDGTTVRESDLTGRRAVVREGDQPIGIVSDTDIFQVVEERGWGPPPPVEEDPL